MDITRQRSRSEWPATVRAVFPSLHAALLLSLLGAAALPGCGEGGRLSKVIVEGSASYDGKKITNGDIRFIPAQASMGPVAGAEIVDGRYRLTNRGGVPVGKHQVVLRAFIIEGVGSASPEANPEGLDGRPAPRNRSAHKPPIPIYMVEGRPQFLPPQYNSKSALIVEITGDSNPQTEDFNMRSESTGGSGRAAD